MTPFLDRIPNISPSQPDWVERLFDRAYALERSEAQEAVRCLCESHEALRLRLDKALEVIKACEVASKATVIDRGSREWIAEIRSAIEGNL